MDSRNYLDTEGLMKEFGIAKQTVYNWTCSKRIPYYKIGKRLYFKRTDIQKYIENCKVEAI